MMITSQVVQMCVAFVLATLVYTEAIQIWMVLLLSSISLTIPSRQSALYSEVG